MEVEEKEKREKLLKVFRESDSITITEACKLVGVARQTFYYFLETDPNFKLEILKIKQEKLSRQIATAV